MTCVDCVIIGQQLSLYFFVAQNGGLWVKLHRFEDVLYKYVLNGGAVVQGQLESNLGAVFVLTVKACRPA